MDVTSDVPPVVLLAIEYRERGNLLKHPKRGKYTSQENIELKYLHTQSASGAHSPSYIAPPMKWITLLTRVRTSKTDRGSSCDAILSVIIHSWKGREGGREVVMRFLAL